MKNKYFLFGILFIFLIGLSSASTTIYLKTLPEHTVFLTPLKTGVGYSAIMSPQQSFSNQYGEARFILEIEDSHFDLLVIVKNGTTLALPREELREGFESNGDPINITVAPEGFVFEERPAEEPPIEEVEEKVEINVTNETSEKNKTETSEDKKGEGLILGGISIIEENKPMVNTIYYSLIGITAMLLIFFTFRHNRNELGKVFPGKKNAKIPEGGDLEMAEEELRMAGKKVEELEESKKEKINDVKKRLIEDEKELIELRGSERKKAKESKEKKEGEKKDPKEKKEDEGEKKEDSKEKKEENKE